MLADLLPEPRLLAERVRINCMLGSRPPAEAGAVARVALGLGVRRVDLAKPPQRRLGRPLDPETRAAYEQIRSLGSRAPRYLSDDFTLRLIEHGTADWKCRAGPRTFHVCEDDRVYLCAPRVGSPGILLAGYTAEHTRRAFDTPKPCAASCPIACAHHASRLDRFRGEWLASLTLPPPGPPLVQLRPRRAV